MDLTRRQAITAISALFAPPCALPFGRSKFHSFSVFSLLRPNNLEIRPVGTARLHCSSSEGFRVIESGQSLRLNSKSVPVAVAGPDGAPVGFVLELPGIIRRAYLGKLQVRTQGNTLRPVVYMDGEVAVGSIVGAELPIGSAAFGALAAQAVLARSFITGSEKPRHKDAEFCDTTHCQFLRAPAAAETETSGGSGDPWVRLFDLRWAVSAEIFRRLWRADRGIRGEWVRLFVCKLRDLPLARNRAPGARNRALPVGRLGFSK